MNNTIMTFKGESFFHDDLQIFINRAVEDHTAPLHNHDFLEIAYVAEGSGFHHIRGEVLRVRKGDLFVIPIGVPHVFRPSGADAVKHPLSVYNCVFSNRVLDRVAAFITDAAMAEFVRSLFHGELRVFTLIDQGDTLEKLFLSLHREYKLPQSGSAEYLVTLILQLLITLKRFTIHDGDTEDAARATPFVHWLQVLDDRVHEEITLAAFARLCGYSERQLQRLFKRHTGQTFHRYKQNKRVERSCELLRHTPLKISAVAEKVGYKDMNSFLHVFKRCTGMSPSEYRRS